MFVLLSPRDEREIRLGEVAAELLPLICDEPSIAFGAGLHAKLESSSLTERSLSDVYFALKQLEAHGMVVAVPENPEKPKGRIFYRLTWLASFLLSMHKSVKV